LAKLTDFVTDLVTEEIDDDLTKCHKCGKIVPITMMCIYCGAPILYRSIGEKANDG